MKKRGVRVRILKPYKAKCVNFALDEIVWVTQELADELILADAAAYPDEEIDIEIERITAANPEAIRKLNAKLDADIAAGRCEPGGFAPDIEYDYFFLSMLVDEETDEILARIGLLVLATQATEKVVDGVLTFVFQGKEKLTLEVFGRLDREKRSRTLGRLIKQMRDRVDIHPDLDVLIHRFVEHRNQLIHCLDDVPGWDLDTPDGRDIARKFLSDLQNESSRMLEIFTGFLIAWDSQNEQVIRRDLPELSKGGGAFLSKAELYAAAIEELVFEKSKPKR